MTRQVTFFDGRVLTSGFATQDDLDRAEFIFDVADDVEDWRLTVGENGELIIAYEGQNAEEALASLAADQELKRLADEAALTAENAG